MMSLIHRVFPLTYSIDDMNTVTLREESSWFMYITESQIIEPKWSKITLDPVLDNLTIFVWSR